MSISKKYIKNTLLTKGLEFDTVVIINAHKFNCAGWRTFVKCANIKLH